MLGVPLASSQTRVCLPPRHLPAPPRLLHRSLRRPARQRSAARLHRRCTMTKAAAAVSHTDVRAQVSALLSSLARLPRLVVFDLDYCLWPFWCEMYTVHDEPRLYPEVLPILDTLREHKVPLALASRTPTPEVAQAFLQKLDLAHYFSNIQLIPAADGWDQTTSQKDTCHFPNLRREMGIEYSDMLFYDDEHKNVHKVSKLGVCSVLVSTRTGVNVKALEEGLRQFAAQQAGS